MRKISKILCIMFILHDALIKFDPINYTKLPEENFKIQTWFYLHWIAPVAIRNHHLHTSPHRDLIKQRTSLEIKIRPGSYSTLYKNATFTLQKGTSHVNVTKGGW